VKRHLASLTRPAAALAIALLLGAVIIAVVKKDIRAPLEAYAALFSGAVGSPNAHDLTLVRTTPILLTGISVAVALAAGLFNIGAEGQMTVGALAAAVTGYGLRSVPAPLLLPLCLIAAMAAGAAWAFLPAFLKVKRGAHEVITAILLNYIAQNTTRYLATVPLRDPVGQAPRTPEVAAVLPRLLPAYEVTAGLLVAVATVCLLAWALRNTVWGYETRAVGQGPGAAEAAGVRVGRIQINAMMAAGALSGLAGAVVVLGASSFRRFPADFYGIGYGFDGLAVALLAGGSAWAVLPSALLFGALSAGADAMDFNANTPKQIVQAVQAIILVAVAARVVLRQKRAVGGPPAPQRESGMA
jgi:simple sugar transport system permease protein